MSNTQEQPKKQRKKKKSSKRFNTVAQIIAIVYLLFLLVFECALVALDVLPGKQILIVAILLAVVSAGLFWMLFFKKRKYNAKLAAMVIAISLCIIYLVGTIYMVNTLAFLGKVSQTSTSNKDAVAVTQKPFNLYITGNDSWGPVGSEEGRSDVNMIVTVNPKSHTILLTSIPRDYEIRLRNHGNAVDKLTHTGFYGVDDTITSVEDLLDININYYVRVNFQTIKSFVDAIGGVDVNSELAFSSHYGGDGDKIVHKFVKGMNHLDGSDALAFARERHSFLDGDRQRVRNQQLVFQAMLEKATSSSTMVTKYNTILNSMSEYFEMNLTSRDIRALMKMQLEESPSWTIKKNSLTGGDGQKATYSGGEAYIMLQSKTSINRAEALIDETMKASDNSLKSSVQNVTELYNEIGLETVTQ